MSLVGKKLPDIVAKAVMPDNQIVDKFNLNDYFKGKYGVLFFYPLDFTFVCPTEIVAFSNRIGKFKELGAEVVGCSIDSVNTHAAWMRTPLNEGGIKGVTYPLLSDLSKNISRQLDILVNEEIALRATLVIDKNGVVRHMSVNDLPIGRNIDEYIRIIEAIAYHEEHGEVCPAGWTSGKEGMVPTTEGAADYLTSNAENL
jgi:peroxiredoxin 2/4